MKHALAVFSLLVLATAARAATDVVTVGTLTAPHGTVSVPIYLRDVSTTRLGVDRPSGQRIQGLGFKFVFSPAAAVSSAAFTRAGTLAKTPLYETNVQAPGSSGYVASFAESNNALLFTSNAAGNGNVIGYLSVTLAPGAVAGSFVAISIDPAAAIVSNQAGSIVETYRNAGLTLQSGGITVTSDPCAQFRSAVAILQSGNDSSCSNGTGGTASVTTQGGNPTAIQWGWRATANGTTTPIAGANEPSYTITGSDFGGTGTRYLVATVSSSCAQIVSNAIPVTITSVPNVAINASSGVYASSTENFASVPDQGAGATYAWSITNGTITSGATTRSIQYTAGASGNVVLDVTVTGVGCAGPAAPQATVPIIARPAGAAMLYLLPPCRILDTRGGPPLATTNDRFIHTAGLCGIPVDAKALAANVTVIAPAADGYVALFPTFTGSQATGWTATEWSGTSTLNYRTGRTRANSTVVAVATPSGYLSILNRGAAVHALIDVTGYFK